MIVASPMRNSGGSNMAISPHLMNMQVFFSEVVYLLYKALG